MDPYKIDSHKLMHHLDRVQDYLEGKLIYPIYIEISPAGACNHRCTFCAVDYIGYMVRFLDTEILKERLSELAGCGVKSVMYAGEGEPLLHTHLAEIIVHTKRVGIDVAVTTNAVALTDRFAHHALGSITWIKASINAGVPETYAKIHQTKPEDFDRVFLNLAYAVKVKREEGHRCTIGAQMLLLPENHGEAAILATRLRDIGADYLVIKPYSQHLMSITQTYRGLDYSSYCSLKDELDALSDDNFQVVFRLNTMKKLQEPDRYYKKCSAVPHFWAYIMAHGDLYGCSAYLEDKRFYYGNILRQSFKEIWEGELRKKSQQFVEHELDISECRKNCRMDEVNRFLWDVRNPPAHVNFI